MNPEWTLTRIGQETLQRGNSALTIRKVQILMHEGKELGHHGNSLAIYIAEQMGWKR